MTTRITNTTHLAQVGPLVDKMLGYPKEPTHRGERCPATPFGRTERAAAINTPATGIAEYPLTNAAEAELTAGAPLLSIAERSQLNVIRAAGEVLAGAQAAKEM